MKLVPASLATTVLLIIGAGLAWSGLHVAYTAIDPDAYRDSAESTYLIVGGMLLAGGLMVMLGAIAVTLIALEVRMPRWLPLVVLAVGFLPFGMLMGGVAIAINLLLLLLAGGLAYLTWQKRSSWS